MPAAELILLIEDDADLRGAVVAALAVDGHRIETAASGPEGLRRACALDPSVVLCDLGLPDIDGWEVIRALRAGATGARTPRRPYVIAMSGWADARSRQLAFEAGCDEYIVKAEGVVAGIQAALRARAQRLVNSGILHEL